MKFYTRVAGVLANVLFLTGAALFWQISTLRQLSRQVNAELRRELEHYRIIMLAPHMPSPRLGQSTKVQHPAENQRLQPLAIANPRILQALDPGLRDFVKENPELESVITREVVRDVDSKDLDVRTLMEKSLIELSFGLDKAGHILWRRIDQSSRVASIDHLAMELVQLLEKYQVLQVIEGIDEVRVAIRVDRQIDIDLEGIARPEAQIDAIKGRIEAGLVLWRLLLSEDATSYLQGVSIIAQEDRILVSKTYDKDAMLQLLTQYYQPGPTK